MPWIYLTPFNVHDWFTYIELCRLYYPLGIHEKNITLFLSEYILKLFTIFNYFIGDNMERAVLDLMIISHYQSVIFHPSINDLLHLIRICRSLSPLNRSSSTSRASSFSIRDNVCLEIYMWKASKRNQVIKSKQLSNYWLYFDDFYE